jgi:hypothetical protein
VSLFDVPTEAIVRRAPTRTPAQNRARSAREREHRPLTISLKVIRSTSRMTLRQDLEPIVESRPRTRADCASVPRPCPWVGCRYNLFLDVTDAGGIKLNFPDLGPDEMRLSCALDVAEDRPMTLDELGRVLNVTRQRAEQIEKLVLERIRAYRRAEIEAIR